MATGSTRVSMTYAMNKLQDEGAISLHRGRIEVLVPDVLTRFSSANAVLCQSASAVAITTRSESWRRQRFLYGLLKNVVFVSRRSE
jgi:hypothetical protein